MNKSHMLDWKIEVAQKTPNGRTFKETFPFEQVKVRICCRALVTWSWLKPSVKSNSEKTEYSMSFCKMDSIFGIGNSKCSKHLLTGMRLRQTLSCPTTGAPALSKQWTITCPMLCLEKALKYALFAEIKSAALRSIMAWSAVERMGSGW